MYSLTHSVSPTLSHPLCLTLCDRSHGQTCCCHPLRLWCLRRHRGPRGLGRPRPPEPCRSQGNAAEQFNSSASLYLQFIHLTNVTEFNTVFSLRCRCLLPMRIRCTLSTTVRGNRQGRKETSCRKVHASPGVR